MTAHSHPSTIAARPSPTRAPRTSRLIIGNLRRADGAMVGARIRNLSSSGLGGKADAELARGETVEVMLPGLGSISGHVAWAHHGKFGIALDTVIDPGRVTFEAPRAMAEPYLVPTRHRPVSDYKRPAVRTR